MTRGDLRNLCLYWLDDLQGAYFTPTQMNVFINNAQREVQKQLMQAAEDYYLKVLQTVTVQGQGDYVLPADFYKLRRLEYILSGTGVNEDPLQLQSITLNQRAYLPIGTGTPANYILKSDRFTILPFPDTPNVILRLYYTYRIADMTTDADVPDVPEDYHEYIAVLAALDGFVKDDRSPQNLVDKREAYLKLMKQTAEDRKADRSRQVIVRDQTFGVGW